MKGTVFMPILKRGSSDPDVQALQQRLSDLGFDPNGVDGNFGPGTEKAVRAFQAAKGLGVDGKVGPNTLAALDIGGGAPSDAGSEPVTSAAPSAGGVSANSQKRLDKVHPKLAQAVAAVINTLAAEGLKVEVVQGLRTFAEQDALSSPRDGPNLERKSRKQKAASRITIMAWPWIFARLSAINHNGKMRRDSIALGPLVRTRD